MVSIESVFHLNFVNAILPTHVNYPGSAMQKSGFKENSLSSSSNVIITVEFTIQWCLSTAKDQNDNVLGW